MDFEEHSNKVGGVLVLIGAGVCVITLLAAIFGDNVGFWDGVMWIAIGVLIIVSGVYIRVVGAALLGVGSVALLLALLHAILVEWAGLNFLKFGMYSGKVVWKVDFLIGLAAAVVTVAGYFCTRTDEELEEIDEAWERRIREARRREAIRRPRETVSESRMVESSRPKCQKCGKEAGGAFSWNSTLRCKGCGMIVCTSCLKSTGLTTGACPQCGNEDLDSL